METASRIEGVGTCIPRKSASLDRGIRHRLALGKKMGGAPGSATAILPQLIQAMSRSKKSAGIAPAPL